MVCKGAVKGDNLEGDHRQATAVRKAGH
jgi:hypothetical protein